MYSAISAVYVEAQRETVIRPILIAFFALVALSSNAFAQDEDAGDGQDAVGGTSSTESNTSDPFGDASTQNSNDPALLELYAVACSADSNSSECLSRALAVCEQNSTNMEACARSTPFIGR
jgi:hypothetical protein